MIKLEAHGRELFEGNVNEGIVMWWVEGSPVVLFQTWEHKASGRVYAEVQQSWISTDLLTYFIQQGWNDEYKIVDVTELKLAK